MNFKKFIIPSLFLVFAPFTKIQAGACYSDPVYERDWHGKYDISAYVRDRACMEGTNIIETVTGGTVVEIIAETDGWYKVRTPKGQTGWTGARLMSITNQPLTVNQTTINNKSDVVDNYSDDSFMGRVRGKLLLQVEDKGRIWYVNPKTNKRYEVTREGAMDLFRNQALGVTNDNLFKIPKHTETNHSYDLDLRNSVRGKILLQVEDAGKTWYVIPGELRRVQITVDTLMNIFRSYSLGISNTDLEKITHGDTNEKVTKITNNLKDSAITPPSNWQLFSNHGFSVYYPSSWYRGVKDYQSNWTYLSEEQDYINNLNTRNYLGVDTYVLVYNAGWRCHTYETDSACLKKAGYYLDGYKITDSEYLKINGHPTLRETLYAPRGTTVYGNRVTSENETIILYTYRNGTDLYRVQYFNAHWKTDYGIEQFDDIARTFSLN